MKYFKILSILFFAVTLGAQTYVGNINYGESSFHFKINLTTTTNRTSAFFTSIEMNAYEIPCRYTVLKNDSLAFYVVSDYYTYEYKYAKKIRKFIGHLKIYANENNLLLNTFQSVLEIENEADNQIIEKREVDFNSNGLRLYGTLWTPKSSIQKGLIFVTSSQGNDRSASNAEASYFANLGYTVFNYDKRGTGKSEGDWTSASIEALCSDDINAVHFFTKTTHLSLSDIGIKGSSQGGIKIPYILTQIPELKYGISISCPSGTLLESDLNHWKNIHQEHINLQNMDVATKIQKAAYKYLANAKSYKKLRFYKNKYNQQVWFQYVWIPDEDIQKDDKLNFSGLPYFKKISQPILLIQGLADNVIPEDSYQIIQKALTKSNQYTITTLENTTHSMMYLDKEYPYFQTLSPRYLSSIVDWLQTIEKK